MYYSKLLTKRSSFPMFFRGSAEPVMLSQECVTIIHPEPTQICMRWKSGLHYFLKKMKMDKII